jgi:hypothetical protein
MTVPKKSHPKHNSQRQLEWSALAAWLIDVFSEAVSNSSF